jgi:hypothetical protein
MNHNSMYGQKMLKKMLLDRLFCCVKRVKLQNRVKQRSVQSSPKCSKEHCLVWGLPSISCWLLWVNVKGCRTLMEWRWLVMRNPIPVPLCPPQVPHGLPEIHVIILYRCSKHTASPLQRPPCLIKEMVQFVSIGVRLCCMTYCSSLLLSLEFGHRLVCIADDGHSPQKEHYFSKMNSCLFWESQYTLCEQTSHKNGKPGRWLWFEWFTGHIVRIMYPNQWRS